MRVRLLILALATAAAAAGAPATALGSSSDAAATQAYVQANYALVRVARAHLAASEAAPLQVLAHVRRECPDAGAGSPQDPESTQLSNEVIGAMVLSAAKPDLSAIRTFVRAVAGLRWSSHALSGAIHAYVGDLKTVLGLSAPNLCGDVKAWSADGYHALPASTVAFVGRFMPAWVALGYQPAQLRGYESGSARALAGRSLPLEEQLSEGEARAVEHWGEIMNALMLWP
ncbi:MAG TPA: hypothetical protein VMF09_06895 [Solirubrobacteraceae bacterium]|nr:hypothetical protein [Solirubrobacteraceae bacterium]